MDIGAKQAWDVHHNAPEVDANLRNPGEFATPGRVPVGLAGVGRWGTNLLRVLKSTLSADLVGVADPRGCADASLDAEAGISDLLEYDLEAVLIATPSHLHFAHARAALEAGRHVFVEKPFASSSAEATELNRLADGAERCLMVGHVLRYHPGLLSLRELVRRGVLGDPTGFSCGRFVDRASTEDPWWCLAPHDLSLVDFVLGPIGSLACEARGAGTHSQLRLRHTPVRGTIEVGMGCQKRSWFSVRCEGGEVSFRSDLGGALLVNFEGREHRYAVPQDEPLRLEVEHFLRCVRLGDVPRSDGKDGLRVVQGLEAGDRSQRCGGRWQDVE